MTPDLQRTTIPLNAERMDESSVIRSAYAGQSQASLAAQFSDMSMSAAAPTHGCCQSTEALPHSGYYHQHHPLLQRNPCSQYEEIKEPPTFALLTGRHQSPPFDRSLVYRHSHRSGRKKQAADKPYARRNKPGPSRAVAEPFMGSIPGPVLRLPCQWGTCGVPLDDITPGGINRHLRAFHADSDTLKGTRMCCEWWSLGKPCEKELDFACLGTHISSMHLRATARPCSECGRMIGRQDSMKRHKDNSCPARLI